MLYVYVAFYSLYILDGICKRLDVDVNDDEEEEAAERERRRKKMYKCLIL